MSIGPNDYMHRGDPHRVGRSTGFTLIEMLVAIAIFGIMAGVAYRALTSVLDTRERLDIEHRKWRGLSIAFARIEQDLGAIRARPARDTGGVVQPPLVGVQVARSPNEGQVMFSRAGYNDEKGIPGAPTRVGYRVREGVLEYMTWTALDQAPRTEPVVSELFRGVSELRVRYLDGRGQWNERWPAGAAVNAAIDDAKAIMPRALEFELQLQSGERIRRIFAPMAGGNR
ncbi:MAG: type II secretion system minor pseudopilin GspJ [Burkholderiales bacterium]